MPEKDKAWLNGQSGADGIRREKGHLNSVCSRKQAAFAGSALQHGMLPPTRDKNGPDVLRVIV